MNPWGLNRRTFSQRRGWKGSERSTVAAAEGNAPATIAPCCCWLPPSPISCAFFHPSSSLFSLSLPLQTKLLPPKLLVFI